MSFIKEMFSQKEKNLDDYNYVCFILRIEAGNLKIEASKFHQAIAKSNTKMKKTTFLRYLYYYVKHITLSEKELEKLKTSPELKQYLHVLIIQTRVTQILKLVQPNCEIIGDFDFGIFETIHIHSEGYQVECNNMIEKIKNDFDRIQKEITKKYRYSKLEKIELEKVEEAISEKKTFLDTMIKGK